MVAVEIRRGFQLKLLMIEVHPLVRDGLRQLVRQSYPEMEIVEAVSAEEGSFLALTTVFDLVLLNLSVPWHRGGEASITSGLAILDALRLSADAPSAVVMSGVTRKAEAAQAWQRGAAAVISKDAAPEALWEAMKSCLLGKGWAGSAKIPDPPPAAVPASLTPGDLGITPRMYDVLKLALQGHPAKKIARILDINDSNVRRYLSRLYEKFGVAGLNGLQAHFGLSGRIMSIVASSAPEKAAA